MAKSHKTADHPGAHVREHVIPSGMSVTNAAKRLGIGRVALSNFLNGKSGLSAEMAVRLEKAYGADREELANMQAAYDRQKGHAGEKQVEVRAFVPPFLSIKAREIQKWAEEVAARDLLPVLLRKLVHSTNDDLHRVDFAGYDNAQRRGPDGLVDAGAATPWVPEGRSYWEFGTSRELREKADRDYAARVRSIDPGKRADSTFVFVTPRNWLGKANWEAQKSEAGDWNAVRAFDASDLEQWLEQSVPGQIWFFAELNRTVDGCETLQQAWNRWADASEPSLTPDIFAPAVAANSELFKAWLEKPCDAPFVVAADSRIEALAFLACLFNDERIDASKKDLAAVFSSPETLRKVLNSSVPFIPIVHAERTERELGGAHRRLHCIVCRHRNSVEPNADVELKLLRDDDFRQALTAMGLEEPEIDRLARESGHSPTILRRRLSKNSAIRKPEWASDDSTARTLMAVAFIGGWHADVKMDLGIISDLADRPYDEVERELMRLRELDDSPVWSAGRHRGVASKIDALFAVARMVTSADLGRFFDAAKSVLSESDPALDLREDDRWAAVIFDKERKHSDALREGLCETLVLLSVHGNHLFQNRLGIDVESRVASLIRELLTPLTIEKLLSQTGELPHYAEAAPDTFLQILEEDRQRGRPIVLDILKPTRSDPLSAWPPRTGLLWALECLAWNPKMLARVAQILGWLSQVEINDNWANKPDESLKAIFRFRMPQTAASIPERVATLKLLTKSFPDVAWKLCFEQVKPGRSFGFSTYKPRWRNDASGAGQVVTGEEVHILTRQSLGFLIAWASHDEKTLGDLVEILEVIPEQDELRIWEFIDEWSQKSGEVAKSALRERIRQSILTSSGRHRDLRHATRARARDVHENLRADDPVARHNWLFVKSWVHASAKDLEDEDFDSSKPNESIDRQRRQAMTEIWSKRGFSGVQDLFARSEAPYIIGSHAALPETGVTCRNDFIRSCLSLKGDLREPAELCLQGFLSAFKDYPEAKVLQAAADELDGEELKRLLTSGPFQGSTWRLLDDHGEDVRIGYWKGVIPQQIVHAHADLTELIDGLLSAARPRAAFHAVQWNLNDIETFRLKRILFDAATVDAEPAGHFMLDRYYISEALEVLDGRTGVTLDEMAQLEFLFIDCLDDSEHGIPNLETRISHSPELFVRAVALAFGRSDEGEDSPNWRIEDETKRAVSGMAARRLLDQLKRIPGADEDGEIEAEQLTKWIAEVRRLCRLHARVEIGDHLVGQLLARAPGDENEMWPCEAVCQAMEGIASSEVGRGFEIGVISSRGVHARAEGGSQEHEIAAKYRKFAGRLRFEYPNVGGVLDGIAKSYEQTAEWWDSEAEAEKHLYR